MNEYDTEEDPKDQTKANYGYNGHHCEDHDSAAAASARYHSIAGNRAKAWVVLEVQEGIATLKGCVENYELASKQRARGLEGIMIPCDGSDLESGYGR